MWIIQILLTIQRTLAMKKHKRKSAFKYLKVFNTENNEIINYDQKRKQNIKLISKIIKWYEIRYKTTIWKVWAGFHACCNIHLELRAKIYNEIINYHQKRRQNIKLNKR